jgi:hypothetical protein
VALDEMAHPREFPYITPGNRQQAAGTILRGTIGFLNFEAGG